MRTRLAIVLAVGMLVASFAAQPAVSAVVIKGVACSACAQNYKWKPRSVSVATGTKVVWKSVDGPHNVTSIGSNWTKSTSISQGQQTSFTFNRTGTFRFRCTLHSTYNSATKKCSGMCGKVVVG
jgi:plastocyanin